MIIARDFFLCPSGAKAASESDVSFLPVFGQKMRKQEAKNGEPLPKSAREKSDRE